MSSAQPSQTRGGDERFGASMPVIGRAARALLAQTPPLVMRGQWDEVLAIALQALSVEPNSPYVWYAVGSIALNRAFSGRNDLLLSFAVPWLKKAAEAMPDHVQSAAELVLPSLTASDDDSAEKWARRAMQCRSFATAPERFQVLSLLVLTLHRLGRHDEAHVYEDSLLAAWNTGSDTLSDYERFHLEAIASDILLQRGNYRNGWKVREQHHRRLRRVYASQEADWLPDPSLLPPEWDGRGKGRVLLVLEHGRGDALQVCRYISQIADRSEEPVNVICHKPGLAPFVRTLPGVATAHDWTAGWAHGLNARPRWIMWAMSAPHVFEMSEENLPAPIVSPSLMWIRDAARDSEDAARVGICWAGATGEVNSECRNILNPASILAPLWSIEGINWVNLQQGLPAPLGAPFAARTFNDYLETAVIIRSLDLCVTVDTSIAHLAGTLGVPTLVMGHSAPDWRWLTGDAGHSLWYPSVRVFQKRHRTDWPIVVDRVRAEICDRLDRRRQITGTSGH